MRRPGMITLSSCLVIAALLVGMNTAEAQYAPPPPAYAPPPPGHAPPVTTYAYPVAPPPVPPQEYIPPPPPGRPVVWRPGYWQWHHHAYVWIPGAYVRAPHPGAIWIAGQWVPRGHRYVWLKGYWQ
jgi:hypothetical protein